MQVSLRNRCIAEFFGTFWLVFGGCGAAVFAAAFPSLGIGFLGVGLVAGKRFPAKEILPYWIAQVVGALVASGVLYIIFTGRDTWALNGFASNGYGVHSPGGYNLLACLVAETLLTFFFILVIMGSTDERAAKGLAPLAIGLCLTLIHLISIPITNTSVNPARSTGPAIVVAAGGDFWALGQLWLFWVAPLIGGLLAGLFYNAILAEHLPPPVAEKPITFSA